MFKKKKIFYPELHFNIERWKYYMPMDVYISSFGRFKDKDGNILSCTAKGNYLVFRGELVHRLVMAVFNPQPGYAGLTVDHLDHNTRNNRLDNLEWVTEEENKARAQKDQEENLRTMLEVQEEKLAKYQKAVYESVCVKLNGAAVPMKVAYDILTHSKDLKNSKSRVIKIFDDIKAGATKADEITIGNFTIGIIKE